MSEEFKILSARDHARTRMGMYVGSSSLETIERFVLGEWKSVSYVPALNKMIDEIIDNSIDEAIRTKFQYANKINVSIENDVVTVSDNGRGIPQDEVTDENGETLLRPVAAWTRTNAGTSFTDERTTVGANGLGSAVSNYLSIKFTGKTWKDGTEIVVDCKDGANEVNVKKRKKQGSGTVVSFQPDFSLFDVNSLEESDTVLLVQDRITSLQLAFPEINFYFNGKRIKQTNLKKYAQLFVKDESSSIVNSQTENISFFFVNSEDGFRTNSYVNGVNTRLGGSYVDFVVNSVVEELSTMIKKKYKVDVTKSVIKNGLTFVMFARNFKNPKFDSQTKERLTNTLSEVKDHWRESGNIDFKNIAKKIISSNDIIEPIVEAQLAKKIAADKRAATLAQKKLKKVKVAKHIAANKPDSTLFICEGDSAISQLIKVRDPDTTGGYPLRGVIMNTWDMKPADVLKNKELSELISVLGLDINDPDSVDNMNYKYVAALTDADADGSGHIAPLIIAFFYKYWPRLFDEKKVFVTRTPIMISSNGKEEKWFYTYKDANKFKENSKNYKHRYIKGLASLTQQEYSVIINDPVLDVINVDDPDWFEIMFGKESTLRKEFLI